MAKTRAKTRAKKLTAIFVASLLAFGGALGALPAAAPGSPAVAFAAGGAPAGEDLPARQEVNFNAGWKYSRGSNADGASATLDDSSWTQVSLPHSTDYVMYNANDAYIGQAWYRKAFTLPEELSGKRIFVNFGAAMQKALVYVNGALIATHEGGFMGFTYDITDYVHTDGATEDLLAVNIDTTYSGNWNPGQANVDFRYHGGLYRSVKLQVTEPVHITDPLNHSLSGASASANTNAPASGGVFIHSDTATSYASAGADMGITNIQKIGGVFTGDVSFWIGAHVKNDGTASVQAAVKNELFDPDGGLVWSETSSAPATLAAGADLQLAMTGSVSGAKLWHPNSPFRYTLETTVYADGLVTDSYTTKTGFRKIALGNGTGSETSGTKGTIAINGELWTGLGTNTHQEIGMVGFAVPEDAAREEVRMIKDAGFDIIRLAHYPYQTAFLDACDEYGVMVQEPITGWQTAASTSARQNFAYAEAKDMMRRDRNHPSIALWELAINEANNSSIASTIVANAKLEFPTKQLLTTGEQTAYDVDYSHSKNGGFASGKPNLFYEYGDWEYGGYASSSRHLRWNSSEAYLRQSVANFQTALDRSQASMLNMGFYWVWQDYTGFGEGDPANASTGDGSRTSGRPTPSGIVDMFRIPKYAYYYAQSQRDPSLSLTGIDGVHTGPMVYIATRWFDETSAAKNDVPVYTNCDSVKLFGDAGDGLLVEIGGAKTAADAQKSAERNGTSYAQTTNYKATAHRPWTFTGISHDYAAITAIGYDSQGAEIARHSVADPRALAASQIRLTWQSDWNSDGTASAGRARPLVADGGDKRLVYIDITDSEGNLISNSGTVASSISFDAPTANATPVTVRVEGDAWLLGGESSNAPMAKTATITPRAGRVAVWVAAGHTPDDTISVTATASGLSSNTLTLATVAPAGLQLGDGGGPADPDADSCLAAKGLASASSGTAALANDGDDETAWTASDGAAGQYWQVDLRARYDIQRISVLWGGNGSENGSEPSAYRYWAQYSTNGQNWLPLVDMTGNEIAEPETEFVFASNLKSARYIRLLFTEASAQPFSINEAHVYGEASSNAVPSDAAESKPSYASGLAAGSEASYGNDGDPARYYTAPDAGGGHSWHVDMQGYYNVSSITIAWKESAAHAYKFDVSKDGKTWETVLTKTRNTDPATVASSDEFAPALAGVRFVRITSGPGEQPMSFSRLSVWGVPASDLAFGKAISAPDGGSAAGRHPVYANDGDDTTYWAPVAGAGAGNETGGETGDEEGDEAGGGASAEAGAEAGGSLTVDLGANYDVFGARVAWSGNAAHTYTLLGSPDGETWRKYYSAAQASGAWNGVVSNDAVGVSMPDTRYVRLASESADGVASFEVYGAAAAERSASVGANLLANPGFADSAGDLVSRWSELPVTSNSAAQSATRAAAATAAHNVTHGSLDDRFAYMRLSGAAHSASLYQTVAGLPDGLYEFRGWVKRGPDSEAAQHSELYAYVENYGGDTLTVDLLASAPRTAATYQNNLDNRTDGRYPYTEITISDIHVTNGKATIGFYANSPNAGADNYLFIDDLSFRLIQPDPAQPEYGADAGAPFAGLLDISKNGGAVVADYTARNLTDSPRGAVALLASYDASGALAGLSQSLLSMGADEVARASVRIDGYDASFSYKAFLWDAAGFAPVAPAAELAVKSIDPLYYSINQNDALTLAETVTVRYNDSIRGADEAPVAWDSYGPFSVPGVFEIYGSVEGTGLRAKATVTVKGANLITDNPSFSTNTTGWTLTGSGLSRATSSSEYRTSPGALKFWNNSTSDRAVKSASQTRTLAAGTYVLSVYNRGNISVAGAYLQLFATAGGETTAYEVGTSGNDWILVELTFTVPESGSVEYGIQTDTCNPDWFQFDDFSLCQIA
jgi:hypothetical protein